MSDENTTPPAPDAAPDPATPVTPEADPTPAASVADTTAPEAAAPSPATTPSSNETAPELPAGMAEAARAAMDPTPPGSSSGTSPDAQVESSPASASASPSTSPAANSADRTLDATSPSDSAAKIADLVVVGNPDLWHVLGKASSESQGFMKTTKVLPVLDYGVIVQTETQQRNPDGSWSLSQSMIALPGAVVAAKGDQDGNMLGLEIVAESVIREMAAKAKDVLQGATDAVTGAIGQVEQAAAGFLGGLVGDVADKVEAANPVLGEAIKIVEDVEKK